MGRLCYPTTAPTQICPGRPESCHGARRVRRSFCRHGTNFIEFWRDRGTSLIVAAGLSPVTKLVAGTGAVSRYKADRSQKTVKVYWILIAGRCASPDATIITNLSRLQEQSKNCDEQLTHIVRVSKCILFIFLNISD